MSDVLPPGWVKVTLKEIVLHKKGKKPKHTISKYKDGYIPYILIGEMEGKPIRNYTNEENMPIADKGDVLIVWDGSIGKTATNLYGVIGSTITALTPIIMPAKFLEYFLKTTKSFLEQTSRGTGLQHINPRTFWPLQIPLPSLNEQKRIVAKLDSIMPRIESVKARLEKVLAILKRFRQSVLTAAVTGRLTEKWREEYPDQDDWINTSLESITEYITSGSRGWAKYYSNRGALFVRAQNINTDKLKLDNVAFVELPNKIEGKRTKIKKNDILVTITGANVTKTALVDIDIHEAYVNQHIDSPNNY